MHALARFARRRAHSLVETCQGTRTETTDIILFASIACFPAPTPQPARPRKPGALRSLGFPRGGSVHIVLVDVYRILQLRPVRNFIGLFFGSRGAIAEMRRQQKSLEVARLKARPPKRGQHASDPLVASSRRQFRTPNSEFRIQSTSDAAHGGGPEASSCRARTESGPRRRVATASAAAWAPGMVVK